MSNRSNAMANGLSLLSLVLYAGCATSQVSGEADERNLDDSAATEARAIIQIEIEQGHLVSFHEPVPGGLYIAEQMVPGQHFVLGGEAAIDAIAAFSKLRPGVQVPEVLQAAYDRARNLADAPAAMAETHGADGGQPAAAQIPNVTPGVIQQALTSSSSAANFVNNDTGCDWGPTWSTCTVNWGGGRTIFATSKSALCTVDHYAGNGLVVQITVAGVIVSSPFQNPGTIVQYSLGTPGAVVQRRVDLTNAAGDAFHIGCRYGV